MKYLLDTHTFLWISKDELFSSQKVVEIYMDMRNEMYLSLTSVWEFVVKISIGR